MKMMVVKVDGWWDEIKIWDERAVNQKLCLKSMEEWSGGGGEDSNETRLPRKKKVADAQQEGRGRPCLMHVSRGPKEHIHL